MLARSASLIAVLGLVFHPLVFAQTSASAAEETKKVRLALVPQAPVVDESARTSLLAWLVRFQNVVYRMNIRDYLDMTDWDGLLESTFVEEGSQPDAEKKARMKRAMMQAHERMFPMVRPFYLFEDAEVRRIDLEGNTATIIARVWDEDDVECKVRWWLTRHDDGWKMTDFENITVNMRFSVLLLTGFQAAASKEGAGMKAATKFTQMGIAIQNGEIDKAYELIQELEHSPLPTVLNEVFLVAKLGVLSQLDDKKKELKAAMDSLEKIAPASPVLYFMRAAMCHDEADYTGTVLWAGKIGASVGHDEDSWSMLVDAHRELKQEKECLAAAEGWALDYPNSPTALWNYWTSLPASKREAMLKPMLERIQPAGDGLTRFADEAYLEDDVTALKLTLAMMQSRKLPEETLEEWQTILKEVMEEQKSLQKEK